MGDVWVGAKGDDFSCAQAFGDLHRQLASSSRGPNNQDGFPFCQLRPCERKPGGQARVEQGGSGQIIETVRDREDHLTKNDAALCHRSVGWSSLVEVDPRAIVERAHSVYAGDLREDVGAPRLRTARLCSDKRMQPGGANVHAHFPLARRWLREVFKARRFPESMGDSSVHKEKPSSLFRLDDEESRPLNNILSFPILYFLLNRPAELL